MHWLNMGPWPVYLGFTTSRKAFKAEMKRLGVKEHRPFVGKNGEAATHVMVLNGATIIIVTVKKPTKKGLPWECKAGLIAHEATHVVQYIREKVHGSTGETLGDETEAYLVQYIVEDFLQVMYKINRQRPNQPPGA